MHRSRAGAQTLATQHIVLPWLRPRPFPSLLSQLLLATAALLLVQAILTIGLRKAERDALAEGLRRAEAGAMGMEGWLRGSLDGVGLTFDLLQQRQLTLIGGHTPTGLQAMLVGFGQSGRFDIVRASAVDTRGTVQWSSLPVAELSDVAERPYFRAQAGGARGIFVSDPQVGRITGRQVLVFSRALTDADGSFAGVGLVSSNVVAASARMAAIYPPPGLRVTVWRDGGAMILCNLWGALPPTAPVAPPASLVAAIAGRDATALRDDTDSKAPDMLVALRRLPEFGLVLSFGFATQEALEGVASLRALVLALDLAAALLVFGGLVHADGQRARRASAEALAAASANEAAVTRVIDALPGVIYRSRYHPDGTHDLLYAARAFSDMAGGRSGALLGRGGGIWALCDPPQDGAAMRQRFEAHDGPEPLTQDCRILWSDGTRRWARFSERVVARDADAIEIVGLMTDIETETNAAAAAVVASRLATLGEMATGLAHEISQPLTTMSMVVEKTAIGLRRGMPPQEAIIRLERVPALAQRARTIIDHLRLFGRVEPSDPASVKVSDMVAGALTLVKGTLREAGIALSIDLAPGLPPARAGAVLMEQVLMNLLLNARDAMVGAGSARRAIRIAAVAADGWLMVSVADTGPGIAEPALPRVFEPFFTTKPPGQGTGLGLSICHGIVRSFGGRLTADNAEPGAAFGGAVMLIELPIG